MTAFKQPRLTLVGAGPGDEELITVKGRNALRSADVVLYDALVCTSLLKEMPASAKSLYVGKRAGRHSMTQDEINRLIVQSAFQYGHVVRLKGGDPFIFGRGYEEVQFARQWGLQTEVVPGISSATSLTALQGVPLTHRSCSRSFWVLTATTRDGGLSADLSLAVQSEATVVILMGMRKIGAIAALFAEAGKAHKPAMVIQNGSRTDEQVVTSSIANLEQVVAAKGMGAPGIIVVGDVIGLDAEEDHAVQIVEHLKLLRA